MVRRILMVVRRIVVVQNAKIRARFEPQIIGQTRVQARRIVVFLAISSQRQQRVIQVGCIRAALEIRPIVVLEHDDEHRLDGRHGSRPGSRRNQQYYQRRNQLHLPGNLARDPAQRNVKAACCVQKWDRSVRALVTKCALQWKVALSAHSA